MIHQYGEAPKTPSNQLPRQTSHGTCGRASTRTGDLARARLTPPLRGSPSVRRADTDDGESDEHQIAGAKPSSRCKRYQGPMDSSDWAEHPVDCLHEARELTRLLSSQSESAYADEY